MMRPSYDVSGRPFSMVSNIGPEGRLAQLMALLQNPDLPPSARNSIMREIAEIQAQLADMKAKAASTDRLANKMRPPGQLPGGRLASMAAMISRFGD